MAGRPLVQKTLHTVSQALEASGIGGPVAGAVSAWSEETKGYYGTGFCTFMGSGKERYHPAPGINLVKYQETVSWLERKFGFPNTLPASVKGPAGFQKVIEYEAGLVKLIGATSIDRFVKTSARAPAPAPAGRGGRRGRRRVAAPPKVRETCCAKFKLAGGTVGRTMGETPFKYHGDYQRAIRFASEFCGRVHTWADPWTTANALRLAKVGLLDMVLDQTEELEHLPLTTIFLALASAEFGARKGFTLESQKQGGLNAHLQAILKEVIASEPDGLRFVAHILPSAEIFDLVPWATVEQIHVSWQLWTPVFARFLDCQWRKGVAKSSRRKMRVLPGAGYDYRTGTRRAPSGVNSSGWNAVADAWQNMARSMRLTTSLLTPESPALWLKVLQLIANDQFMWGGAAEKKMDPNVIVFQELTSAGCLPWEIALHPESFHTDKIAAYLVESCERNMCSLRSWLGIPGTRKEEVTRVHVDMICGVPVPPMSADCAAFLTSIGVFGAKDWAGK